MCNQGQLISIRLPNGRKDRRISLDSVKLLLKQDGVEIDLRDVDEMGSGNQPTHNSNWPVVVSIGVPFGVLNQLNLGNGHFHQAETLMMGCALVGVHRPDVVILDATAAIAGNESVQMLKDIVWSLCHDSTLILRCYDDPAVYNPRPWAESLQISAFNLGTNSLVRFSNESSVHLQQQITSALSRKGKVPA